MRKFFYTTLFLLAAFTGQAQAEDKPMPLSLKQCIDLSLQNNVDVLVSQARSRQVHGQKIVADADLLPQIDAVASQQRTWWENLAGLGFPGLGKIGPFNSFNASIMVSQRILDLSALAHAQAGKIKWKSSQLQVELARQQIILATGMAYIQTLGYKQELDSSYEDVRLAEHFLSLSLHQLNAGLASSLDVARDRTQLAQQKARQEELRLNLVKAQLELKRLIKIPLSQAIELSDTLENRGYEYLTMEQAIDDARQNRMEIKVAEADNDYIMEELKASKRGRLPTVSLTGQLGEMGLTPQNSSKAANAMVRVSLPIWEGGRVNGEIKEKMGMSDEQRIKTEDLNWKIEEDVLVALETLNSTHAQVEAFKEVQDFAEKELDLAQDRFSAGIGDNIQLIDAQVALADAKDKYVQTLAQYDQAQLNYFAALGQPKLFDLSLS